MGQEKGERKGETKEKEKEDGKLMSAGGTGLKMDEPQFHRILMEAKNEVSPCHESDWKIGVKSGRYSNPPMNEGRNDTVGHHSHWTSSQNGSCKDC